MEGEIDLTIRLNQANPFSSTRWITNRVEPTVRNTGPRTTSDYLEEGFLTLQDALVQSIIASKISNNTQDYIPAQLPIDVRQFPYPKYTRVAFLENLTLILPILLVFSFIFTAGIITKEIVLEKETRLRESMKMMGLSNWVNWLAWFVIQLIFMAIVVLCVTLLLRFCGIFMYSNILIILIWYILYIIYMISLAFLISTFFTSSRIALLVSFLVWFMTFFPYFFLFLNYDDLPLYSKILACFLGNTCFAMSTHIFVSREIEETGITWDNIALPTYGNDRFNILHVYAMLIFTSIIQFVLTWYLDEVLPKKYGIRKPFYFPFTYSYWFGRSIRRFADSTKGVTSLLEGFELEPDDATVGIRIENLTKKYTRSKKALNELSLNMYKGQITALLGHNGAGKSTLISILTGLFPPTKGTAYIEDMNILQDMDSIHEHLGICPQSNILFDRLTVKEHLHFFIRLKGVWGWKQANSQVLEMLSDTKLEAKVNTQSQNLSGGMKRTLSVGLALIGNTSIIILDEPTSGVDPYSRRTTWDLLLKYKENRTMLLTTHHLDEADILGDRIAILSDGVLKCCGSSLFLKNKFGIGYHLTLVKSPTLDFPQVQHAINTILPNARIEDDLNAEISFVIPSHDRSKFENLFQLLEDSSDQLGIMSHGISYTTMEDVFLSINDSTSDVQISDNTEVHSNKNTGSIEIGLIRKDSENSRKKLGNYPGRYRTSAIVNPEETEILQPEEVVNQKLTLNHGVQLWFQQLWAVIVKKAWYSVRRYEFTILQFLLPIIFTALGLAVLKFGNPPPGPDPKSQLSIREATSYQNFASLFHMEVPGPASTLPDNFSLDYISDFSRLTPSVKETSIFSGYTDLVNSIQNNTQPIQCCDYEFQMLDRYCALRTTQDLFFCYAYTNFGYRSCPQCTLCSEASGDPSCPKPVPFISNTNEPALSPLLNVKSVYITEFLLREMQRNVRAFYANFLLGITTDKIDPRNAASGNFGGCANSSIGKLFPDLTRPDRVTLWYNNQGLHMAPTALAVLHNYQFYNSWEGRGFNGTPPKITVNNHPLPKYANNEFPSRRLYFSEFYLNISLSVFLVFGLSILTGSFIIFPLEEKSRRSKFLQFVSGLDPIAYWFGIFLWDLVITLVSCTFVFFLFPIFDIAGFTGEYLILIYLLLLSYGIGSLFATYFISFLFKTQLVGYSLTIIISFFSYLIQLLTIQVVRFSSSTDTVDRLNYIFSIFPSYSLATGIYNIRDQTQRCQSLPSGIALDQCKEAIRDILFKFENPGVLVHIVVPFAVGLVFLILTLAIERFKLDARILEIFWHRKGTNKSLTDEDNDVADERTRMTNSNGTGQAVCIENISKIYPGNLFRRRKQKLAVNQICLGLEYGDCFGLLGINGAGKTTTFEILAGNLRCSSGTALVGGFNIRKDQRKVRQIVGYCPQFDALNSYLTGKQQLSLYARIRGVPSNRINSLVTVELDRMGLRRYANQQSGQYSGGNKRKLSAACALIGNAPILLMDEPTTGMDPGSRRCLWEALLSLTREGRCIILSSHSMEECEALCTKLAIMVNGEFKCIGSTQHLKNKFGEGYTLSLRSKQGLNRTDNLTTIDNIKEFVNTLSRVQN